MSSLQRAIGHVSAFLGAGPAPRIGEVFDASLLAQVSAEQLEATFGALRAQLGACTGHDVIECSAQVARVRWLFPGATLEGSVGVSDAVSGRIVTLQFGLPARVDDSWSRLEADLRAVPGALGFELRDLSRDRSLLAVDPGRPLGIGSTSKLLIYSALLDGIAAGELAWTSALRLEDRHVSAPSGVMHTWPAGSPLTAHTAAVLMLTLSDNTAADLLLARLGRERVEGVASGMGDAGDGLVPFPSTRAIFNLVAGPRPRQKAWLEAGGAARRGLLAELEAQPPRLLEITTEPWPAGIGWYTSARGVCGLLGRIARQLDSVPGAREILGATQEAQMAQRWRFAGGKGGSSPGRLSLSALLESDAGGFFAASLVVLQRSRPGWHRGCLRCPGRLQRLHRLRCHDWRPPVSVPRPLDHPGGPMSGSRPGARTVRRACHNRLRPRYSAPMRNRPRSRWLAPLGIRGTQVSPGLYRYSRS